MAMPSGYCVQCESALARLCFDVPRARWYVHCFECGSEREIENPCDFRRPGHVPVFLPPVSVEHWQRAIASQRRRPVQHPAAGLRAGRSAG